jgi:anti-sigma regulatory factor (Ser/Thr protein kinase)/CheY-like chemotaxis protein
MTTAPFISQREDLFPVMTELTRGCSFCGEVELVADKSHALEFLNTEMPDVLFIDFGSPALDAAGLLESMKGDPWLHHGGIIALCLDFEAKMEIEKFQGANIIAVLTDHELRDYLPNILRIIDTNRRILFQHEIGTDLVGNISATFQFGNDLTVALTYANLVCNFLYNASKIEAKNKEALRLALNELLVNAVEHGNCGISYEEKSSWLEGGGYIGELIRRKNQNPDISKRRVTFEYHLGSSCAQFRITDEGSGFDWRNLKDPKSAENLLKLHGRGIKIARHSTKKLQYNEAGNIVSFEFDYPREVERLTPAIFSSIDPLEIAAGDVVFNEGEKSNFLYYIVKGEYDVFVNATKVSFLNPDDLFMGEMSFLLDNRRSATVVARTPGRLIKLSKGAFVAAIRKRPHYALFLARLLAQRVQRANRESHGSPAVRKYL